MSEKDNVGRVAKLYEAFTKGDIGYIIDQLTDDVRWVTHLDPVVPWAGTFPGKQAVPQFFESIASNIEVTAFTPKEFIAQGDTVVSLGDVGYRSRANGKTAVSNWVFIWKLREGRVYSYEQFHDAKLAAVFR
jgi:ketosteroid isomerase-like protein